MATVAPLLLVAPLGSAGAFAVDGATFGLLALASAGITTRRRVTVELGSSVDGGAGDRGSSPDFPTVPDRWVGPEDDALPVTGRLVMTRRPVGRLSLVTADPVLGPLLVVLTAFVVAGTAVNVAEVLLVTQVLGGGPIAFGATGAVVGGGLVAGSLLARRAGNDRTRVAGTCVASFALGLLITAEGLAPSLPVLFGLLVFSGSANGVLSSCFGQVLVTRSRDEESGRVAATANGAIQTAGIIGLPIGAVLAAAAGPRGTYVAAGVAAVVLTAATTALTGKRLACAVTVRQPDPERRRPSID